MEQRIVGIETEFGCMINSDATAQTGTVNERVVDAVKNYAFLQRHLGLLDLHARDYAFEPAHSGGFLRNGGRLYVDAVGSHEEYATPECVCWKDVVKYDRAGRRILSQILDELEVSDQIAFYANSVDHFGGHTFGCHENFLVDIDVSNMRSALGLLLPFLVTRQIFAGSGRVGGHILNRQNFDKNVMAVGEYEVDTMWVGDFYGVEIDENIPFQLSQRADHIVNSVSGRVRFNRAIINPKHDSFYDYSSAHRLHILFGEANMNEYAMWLKVATTCIVLDLLEANLIPDVLRLEKPVKALQDVSRDQTMQWNVRFANGRTIGAIDLQRTYLELGQKYFSGKDQQTDEALKEWEIILDGLENDPMQLADRVDWVAKKVLLQQFMEAENVAWDADILHSLDLEYHNINPRDGLYYGLEEADSVRRICTDAEIDDAILQPPQNTRARGRSDVINALMEKNWNQYLIDWDWIRVDKERHLELRNPFHDYREEAKQFIRELV